MPNRMLREGLIESERVLMMPVEARWLFVTIVLSADDVGLFEATEFKLARRADINREMGGKLLQLLADADLVRLYEVDGKRYGFVPKFRQRVQIKTTKHPLPPRSLMQGDSDALSKINELASKPSVGAPVGSGCADDGQPSEVEAEVEEKKVSAASQPRRQRKAQTDRVPPCPFEGIVAAYHDVLPELPKVLLMDSARKKHLADLWSFVMTSIKSDGSRRATTAAEGMGWLRGYFKRARDNDWLMGRTQRAPGHDSWRCTIEFLCSSKGRKAVIERTPTEAVA